MPIRAEFVYGWANMYGIYTYVVMFRNGDCKAAFADKRVG